ITGIGYGNKACCRIIRRGPCMRWPKGRIDGREVELAFDPVAVHVSRVGLGAEDARGIRFDNSVRD
ncbi:hypothetical protein PMAYCL1PPCAC_11159, partial [Pristionchus mayeri]